MKTKRPALLLELLIGLFLLATCLLPLLNGLPLLFSKQVTQLREIGLERLADLTYFEIKTSLKERHTWSDLSRQAAEYTLPPITLAIDGLKPKEYPRSYTLAIAREKEGEENTTYRLLRCRITLGKKTFDYKLFTFHKRPLS